MRERKAEERLRARAARKAVPAEARAAKAAAIHARVLALPEVEAAFVVGTYVGVGSEVATLDLVRALFERGQRVAVPLVTPPETMRLAELISVDDLAPGAHQIPEPKPPRVILNDVDALLVPGLLFTRRGERLGNGGGYFDRVLREMPAAFRVGVAYHEQLVGELPIEEHDERMDVVVTDREVVRCQKGGLGGLPPRGS